MDRGAGWLDLGERVARLTLQSDVQYLATAIAYYGFVSFVPLLVLVVAAGGWRLADVVATQPVQLVTPDAQRLFSEALATASGRTGAVLLSVAVLAWGSANVAIGFLTAVERIEAVSDRPLSDQVRDAFVVLGTLSVAIFVILLQTILLVVFSRGLFDTFVGAVVLLAVLTVVFLPLYAVPSRVVDSFRAALPGSFTAACGWSLIHAGVQVYAANAGRYAIYGVLSGIIIILTSIYLAAMVLMIGVVVNAVLAADTGDLLAASP